MLRSPMRARGLVLTAWLLFWTLGMIGQRHALAQPPSTPCAVAKELKKLFEELVTAWALTHEAMRNATDEQAFDAVFQSMKEKADAFNELVERAQAMIAEDEAAQAVIREYEDAFAANSKALSSLGLAMELLRKQPDSQVAKKAYADTRAASDEAKKTLLAAISKLSENDHAHLWHYLKVMEKVNGEVNHSMATGFEETDDTVEKARRVYDSAVEALCEGGSVVLLAPPGGYSIQPGGLLPFHPVFMPLKLGAPHQVDLVGLNPQPEPPGIPNPNDLVGLNPQPEPPGRWETMQALASQPRAERFHVFEPFNAWMRKADPRVLQHAADQASSLAAVIDALSFQGAVNDDSTWIPLAQQALATALSAPAPGEGRVAKIAAEANTILRGMTVQQLVHLQDIGPLSLDQLAKPPAAQQAAGIKFAKVKATTQGQPVPGATIAFSISVPTESGPQQVTQIAKTDENGEVKVVQSGESTGIIIQNKPGEIQVGKDDTVETIVVTGKTGEQPTAHQNAQADPQDATTMVVNAQAVPEFKVTFAAIGAKPDDGQRKQVEEAFTQQLLQSVDAPDPQAIPFTMQSRDPIYYSAHVPAKPDDMTWSPETYIAQAGGPSQDQAAPSSKQLMVWTFAVPRLQSPDGKTLPVSAGQVGKAAAAAASRAGVLFGEVAKPRTAEAIAPDDPYFTSRGSWGQRHADQWALHRVGLIPGETSGWLEDMEATRYLLEPVTVAVIGSGVDYSHPDLAAQMWVNPGEQLNGEDDDANGLIDDVFGWNFRDDSRDVMDYGGHDTHVAGVIAAAWNNRYGIAGVNPAARIMALKVADMFGNSDSAAISQAIMYAVDHRARVINLSYGGDQASLAEQAAIDYAVAHGVLVVVAAGNQATDNSQRGLAGSRGVLTVAATSVEGDRAGFSNWGQAIEIAAPGLDILGPRARGTDFLAYVGDNESYQPGSAVVGKEKDLYRAGGTSFAAPIVAGAASYLWSLQPYLSLDQVRRKLLMGADDIDVTGWDQNSGAGLLNVRKAVAADPDSFLHTRIIQVAPGRDDDGKPTINVHGVAAGNQLTGVWLQVGFGEDPAQDSWKTMHYTSKAVSGIVASIPASMFNRRGVWTVRLLVQDQEDLVRQSRARINLE